MLCRGMAEGLARYQLAGCPNQPDRADGECCFTFVCSVFMVACLSAAAHPGRWAALRTMRSFTTTAALSLGIVCLTGCASIAARTQERADRVYPGVRDNAYYLAHPSEADLPFLQWMNIIDLPFSAVLDTLLWPFDAHRLSRQSTPPEEK
jgi:uncharacterized protein YceK